MPWPARGLHALRSAGGREPHSGRGPLLRGRLHYEGSSRIEELLLRTCGLKGVFCPAHPWRLVAHCRHHAEPFLQDVATTAAQASMGAGAKSLQHSLRSQAPRRGSSTMHCSCSMQTSSGLKVVTTGPEPSARRTTSREGDSSPDQVARDMEVFRKAERICMIVQRRIVAAPAGRMLPCLLPCRQKTTNQLTIPETYGKVMAETKGFEPSRRFPACTLSRGVPSTTRPRLRRGV